MRTAGNFTKYWYFSSNKMYYHIRTMKEEDFPSIVDMRNKLNEFLNSPYQIAAWYKLYPEGFKVAVSSEGVVIGICAAVPKDKNLHHIGLYMVLEEYRRQGIGTKLWNTVWKHIGNSAVVVNAQRPMMQKYIKFFPLVQPNYKRLGYVTDDPVNLDLISTFDSNEFQIEPFNSSHLPAIFDYDRSLIGYNRSSILHLSCHEKRNTTYIAFKNGSCVGFGTMRIGSRGHGLIGPLYCDNDRVAKGLLQALIASQDLSKGFAMITLERNVYAKILMAKLNCTVKYESFALYSKEESMKQFSVVDMNKVYGLFCKSFALF